MYPAKASPAFRTVLFEASSPSPGSADNIECGYFSLLVFTDLEASPLLGGMSLFGSFSDKLRPNNAGSIAIFIPPTRVITNA